MIVLRDFSGRAVRLTDERRAHILRHPEMEGQENRIAEVLWRPDLVVQSVHDSDVCVYHKWYEETPVTCKYLVVVVKYLDGDAFVITAFFTDREKRGEQIWP